MPIAKCFLPCRTKRFRGCLINDFKQQFSVFKQHYTYFGTLFHSYVFLHMFSNNNFQFLSTCTKHPLESNSQLACLPSCLAEYEYLNTVRLFYGNIACLHVAFCFVPSANGPSYINSSMSNSNARKTY